MTEMQALLNCRPDPSLLSVVAPCYNEEEGLDELVARVAAVMRTTAIPFELVLVNDGSTDSTLLRMHRLADQHPELVLVNLTRNFGKEVATTAALAHASGDAVVILDADLQDPPELIARFLEAYREGYDIAYGRRTVREGETWLKLSTARLFYRVMESVGPVKMPADTGDFRLMSRRAVDALLALPETHRFMKGLFAWIGFPAKEVPYVRQARFAGTTKWGYLKLINLSIEGITSFSLVPLRVTTYLGIGLAATALLGGLVFLFRTIFFGEDVRGFPTLFLTMLLIGGVQLLALGVIGEYLGRIFNETKRRPLFLVESVRRARSDSSEPQSSPEMSLHQVEQAGPKT